MNPTDAWNQIFALGCATWQPIPAALKRIVGLPGNVGINGRIIQTQAGARGLNLFINRMNSLQESK